LVGLAALSLAACRPIVVDRVTQEVDSLAEVKVVPATYEGRPAVEIRIRACAAMVVTSWTPDGGTASAGLRPWAMVTDGEGRVVFQNWGRLGGPEPEGQVVDAPGNAGLDTIVVPVDGAPTPLTIEAGCTNYPGYGQAGYLGWTFTPCTTADRTCAANTDGSVAVR
jgi:hypothetical protein